MIYLGIDPGKQGAVAVVSHLTDIPYANVWDTPVVDGEYDLIAMAALLGIASIGGPGDDIIPPVHATLEGGRIMPNRIKNRAGEWVDLHQSAKSAAEQWRGIGIWEGILAALGIPYDVVPPATWKRTLGVTGSAMTDRQRKELAIVKARALFPSAAHLIYRAKDDGRAEALLLAEHGRRTHAQTELAL